MMWEARPSRTIRQEHNIDGWILYFFTYPDGVIGGGIYYHACCMSIVQYTKHHRERVYCCKKCGIVMPRPTREKVDKLIEAVFQRLPTP